MSEATRDVLTQISLGPGVFYLPDTFLYRTIDHSSGALHTGTVTGTHTHKASFTTAHLLEAIDFPWSSARNQNCSIMLGSVRETPVKGAVRSLRSANAADGLDKTKQLKHFNSWTTTDRTGWLKSTVELENNQAKSVLFISRQIITDFISGHFL